MRYEQPGSRASEQQEIMGKAADRAETQLSEQAINPEEFADLYGAETVASDLAYVARREEEFARENARERHDTGPAKVAEAVLGDGIGLYDWMGPSAYFIVPSKYDDLANGIDGLVEFEEEKGRASHLGLALDATYRQDSESKLYTIRDRILAGDAMRMKYFQSEALDMRGELTSLPRTVAAFDYQTIARIGELWLNKDKDGLAKDPVQFQLIEQLMAQCELFEKVSGSERPNLRGKYEHGRELLKGIYRERQQEIEDSGVRDTSSYRLINEIDALKRNY